MMKRIINAEVHSYRPSIYYISKCKVYLTYTCVTQEVSTCESRLLLLAII